MWSWPLFRANRELLKCPTCIERRASQCPGDDVQIQVVVLPSIRHQSAWAGTSLPLPCLNYQMRQVRLRLQWGLGHRRGPHDWPCELWIERPPLHTAPRGTGLTGCFSLFSKYLTEDSGTVPKINEIVLYFGKKIMKKWLILKLNWSLYSLSSSLGQEE